MGSWRSAADRIERAAGVRVAVVVDLDRSEFVALATPREGMQRVIGAARGVAVAQSLDRLRGDLGVPKYDDPTARDGAGLGE